MRADRQLATLLLMQARGRVTAAEVAAELEVSLATSRRDFVALSAAGIPVYPQSGRGGGWSLLGGVRTDLTGPILGEVRALFLITGSAATLDSTARSALSKLVHALPETFRAQAQTAATAMARNPTPRGEYERLRPEPVAALQAAIVAGRKVTLGYENHAHALTRRLVDPRGGVVSKNNIWYLVAGPEAGQRTFRVERIMETVVSDLVSTRPSNFELTREWGLIVEDLEQRRSLVSATILTDPGVVLPLREHFGRHCQELGLDADGRVRLHVAATMARSVAEQLAGWVGAVEVLEPEAVKTHLAALDAELVHLYGPSPAARPPAQHES